MTEGLIEKSGITYTHYYEHPETHVAVCDYADKTGALVHRDIWIGENGVRTIFNGDEKFRIALEVINGKAVPIFSYEMEFENTREGLEQAKQLMIRSLATLETIDGQLDERIGENKRKVLFMHGFPIEDLSVYTCPVNYY